MFFGRLVPTVRTVISVPAGISEMPLTAFLLWTSLGTAVWTTLLAYAGYLLQGQYEAVADYVNPVANVVFGVAAVWYIYRVLTFTRKERAK